MSKVSTLCACACLVSLSSADVIYTQPPIVGGSFIQSSWLTEQGSDYDMYAYDSFVPTTTADVTRVEWQGGYIYGGAFGRVTDFSIYFYATKTTVDEPDCGNPQLPEWYLARYMVGGTAGEALHSGSSTMYDYAFNLPTSFHVTAGTEYWIRILGYQPSVPDWGLNTASGGNGSHFRFSTGAAMFSFASGDTAFTLLGNPVPEPASIAAFSIAALGLLARRRRG